MNYGFYMSTAGLLTGSHAMDVASNNLANVETPGFKVDVSMVRSRDAARVEDGLSHLPSNLMLERLGGGVTPWPARIDFKEGSLDMTSNPLDAAIRGEGFFVVRDGSAPAGDRERLTRDGRFLVDGSGRLVTHDHGRPVLDTNNQPIHVPEGAKPSINASGEVVIDDEVVAQLNISTVADVRGLIKDGDGLFRSSGPIAGLLTPVETPRLQPGAIERSGADPIKAMTDVRAANSMASRNARMIDIHNDAMQMAIARLGRVG